MELESRINETQSLETLSFALNSFGDDKEDDSKIIVE